MQRAVFAIRIAFLATGVCAASGVLMVHFYHLQVERHAEFAKKVDRLVTSSRKERGRRGCIYDCHGNLLAGNLACRDILAEPRRIQNVAAAVQLLCAELGVPRKLLWSRMNQALHGPRVEIVVKRGVPLDIADRIKGYHIRGLRFVDTYKREYPKKKLAANLIGFASNAGGRLVGLSGIEQMYDGRLRPLDGERVYLKDRTGRPIQRRALLERRPLDGADIYLTIDEPIQHIVETELDRLMAEFAPKAAYAVMVNPKTGSVLAMAQRPSFDPNHIRPTDKPWLQNRVLTDGFEPGSVMKGPSVAGALDYGVVTLDTVFDCEDGCWFYAGRPLHDSGHRFGLLTVRQIIQKSSNIGAAKIALAMGRARLYQTLFRFGFGRPTNIGLPGEAPGIFRPLDRWDGLSITRFPIGQGILVTPLQLVQAYSAIANGGIMMQIHVLSRIHSSATGITEVYQPAVKCRVIRASAARAITQALKLVTQEGGTAPKAAVEGYLTAGKTGTAQKVIHGRYSHSAYVSSFIGFVPADDPAFVLLVVADTPSRGGHYGGTVAAPSFRRIALQTLRYLDIAPARPDLPLPTPRPDNTGETNAPIKTAAIFH